MGTAFPAFTVRAAIAGVLVLALATGCKKPEDAIGLSLLDPADTLGTTRIDTVGIRTWPHADQPVRTSQLSTNEVGSYVDDVFGPVVAGTAMQLRLSLNNVGPADGGAACDSLILSLAYISLDPIYGDLDPQVVRVFRLEEDLKMDSLYKSDRQPVRGAQDLVDGAPRLFTPSPLQGPVVGGDTLKPQLRIPLDPAFGNELLSQWGQPTMADNASFLEWMKGVVVAADNPGQAPLQGGVWRFNLLDGASKMTLYYHTGAGEPRSFDFIMGSNSVRYSFVAFDHGAASVPGLAAALADSTLGQVETYVQALGGLRTEVRFPYLEQFRGSALQALAKAELTVPVAGDFHDTYAPPGQLFIFRKAEDGGDLLVPDQVAGQGMVGGAYDNTRKEYRFNITRWVQGVINGTYPNTGLALVAGNNGISVNRVRLAGPDHPDLPMKLVLTFTTY
ncbi:MAG TPA: DUF4270 family protein [Flavobacteriales bacterium]|nr:DUF4270 family protein [Flavobacteriales bacterium]